MSQGNAVHRHTTPSHAHGAIALMYHALSRAGTTPAGQDAHYSLDMVAFERHLRLIQAAGGGGNARDWLAGPAAPGNLLTFDDGHVSNFELAFPALLDHGLSADFFINPANVGRPGFADWAMLREMAGHGMSIQSHGYDHVYLTTLEPQALRDNLQRSRDIVEARIGQPVTLLAPPGGRMPAGLDDVAFRCGYTHVLGSWPGRISARDCRRGMLPRMAVTRATGDEALSRWLHGDRLALARQRLRHGVLGAAKKMLGDSRYERMRSRALAGEGQA